MEYQLLHGDCLDILPTLEAGSVDAVIADTPYGTTACAWDSVIPFEPMWAGIKHVIKRNAAVVLFGSQPFTSALIMSNPKWFRHGWVWDKTRGFNPQLANVAPMKRHEDLLVFGLRGVTYRPQKTPCKVDRRNADKALNKRSGDGLMIFASPPRARVYEARFPTSILQFEPVPQGLRRHPSEKPVALLEYLILTYTNEGETVLDFTMGSGSTGVACMQTGRRFIGIEKDAAYFEIAQERIQRASQQLRLAV